jgi:hypothetical protein
VDGVGRSTPHPIRFTPGKEPRDPLYGRLWGGGGGFRAILDRCVEKKMFCLQQDPKPKPSSPWRVANFLRYPGSQFILWLIELPYVFRKNVLETRILCLSPQYQNFTTAKEGRKEPAFIWAQGCGLQCWLLIEFHSGCLIMGTPIIYCNLNVKLLNHLCNFMFTLRKATTLRNINRCVCWLVSAS